MDVYINNAAVTLFGRIEDAPYEAYRKVIDTNLFGYIHGARAVIPHLREKQQSTLISVSSMVGKIGSPYLSAYCISKSGNLGLSDSLRMELQDMPGIHVSTVLPASIDTPLFQPMTQLNRVDGGWQQQHVTHYGSTAAVVGTAALALGVGWLLATRRYSTLVTLLKGGRELMRYAQPVR